MSLKLKALTAIKVFRAFGILQLLKLCINKLGSGSARHIEIPLPVGVRITASSEWTDIFFSRILGVPKDKVRLARVEYSNYQESFKGKVKVPRKQFFDSIFDLGPGMSEFLYTAILVSKPQKVIETGVAAGVSTNTILSALQLNGIGKLVSIDITTQVGELVDENLKNLWRLQILPEIGKEKAFARCLQQNTDATIFLHDSDHSESWQKKEFENLIREIPGIEFIFFDDIGQGLIDFIKLNFEDYEITVLDEHRKFSGVVHKRRV